MSEPPEGGVRLFVAPHNWCDRLCERCPVRDDCGVFVRERGQRWANTMRGLDPDDPDLLNADAAALLELSEKMLIEFAEKEGIDLDEPIEPAPVVLDAVRLEAVCGKLVAFHDAGTAGQAQTLVLLSGKLARIASYLGLEPPSAESDSIWRTDGAPNFFLVEILLSSLRAQWAAQEHTPALEVVSELERLLARIGPALEPARAELAEWIERGEAPSPYCQMEPLSDSNPDPPSDG